MAREVLNRQAELEEFADLQMLEIEAGVAELARERVARVLVFPGADQAGEAIQGFGIERERFADFARGGAPAVGDDVGGHGRAQLAVALIDILDGALALVAAGEIEIDVGPFAAFLGKKAFEEKVHANGVDGGDAERIADGAIGGGTASLDEDVLLAAVADDVPDDQKIAGKIEALDHGEFALDLEAGAFVFGAVTPEHAAVRAFAQEVDLRFAPGRGIFRELVAEIVQGEFQARGEKLGVGDGFGEIGEEPGHFGGRFQMALGIAREKFARGGEGAVVADAGEHIEDFALRGLRVANAIGREQGQMQLARDF